MEHPVSYYNTLFSSPDPNRVQIKPQACVGQTGMIMHTARKKRENMKDSCWQRNQMNKKSKCKGRCTGALHSGPFSQPPCLGGDRGSCPVFFALLCWPLISHKGPKWQLPHSDHTWKQGAWQTWGEWNTQLGCTTTCAWQLPPCTSWSPLTCL